MPSRLARAPLNSKPHILLVIIAPWICVVCILGIFLISPFPVLDRLWMVALAVFVSCVVGFAFRQYKAARAGLSGRTDESWLATSMSPAAALANKTTRSGGPAWFSLSLICLAACAVSIAVGSYGYEHFLSEYRRLGRGAVYFNVVPTENAVSKTDAAAIVFAPGTGVDASRTFGFADALDEVGRTFCVAPISHTQAAQEDQVQYWAVGHDCCHERGYFDCGQASVEGVRAGIVLDRAGRAQGGFRRAVAAAEQAHGLASGPDALLVRWVAEPVAYRAGLWHHALLVFAAFAGGCLLLAGILGCVLKTSLEGDEEPPPQMPLGFDH